MIKRLGDLVYKLLGLKGIIWLTATAFVICGWLSTGWWAIFSVVLMGWRTFEKIFGPRI